MALDATKFKIEDWLNIEVAGLLQKICNIYDADSNLIGQYKTRVTIVPVGKRIPGSNGQLSKSAPALFRSFSYDGEGNPIAGLPQVAEWTQACEDAAIGSIPDTLPDGPGEPIISISEVSDKNTQRLKLVESIVSGLTFDKIDEEPFDTYWEYRYYLSNTLVHTFKIYEELGAFRIETATATYMVGTETLDEALVQENGYGLSLE